MNSKKAGLLLGITLTALSLGCCKPRADKLIAFTNVNLIPMTSDKVVANQTVIVEGTKITAIGESSILQVPKGSEVIDGHGLYLMPGLADMHMHTREDWEDREIWPVHPLNLYLANGVTTIRDFAPQGSSLTYALEWRDEIRSGIRSGPAIYASGKLLYASPLDDPEGIVRQNHGLGFDFIKLYSYLSKEDYRLALQASKTLNMYTAGHIPYAVGLDGVLAEGMDEIAHVEELLFEFIDFDRNRQLAPAEWITYIAGAALLQFDLSSSTLQADFEKENIDTLAHISQQLQTENIPVCTTMVVDDVIQFKLFQPGVFLERPENIYFEKGYLESFHQGKEKHQVQCSEIESLCAFKYVIDRWILDGLHDAGVQLLLGTDAGTGGMGIIPGYSIHDELRILAENGFSPYEALSTGTVNAASVIGRMTGEGDFGTIEVGKRADLILLKGNPLIEITTIKEPLGVMAAGRWYSDQMLSDLIGLSKPGE